MNLSAVTALLQKKNGVLSVKLRKRGKAGQKDDKDAFKTIGSISLLLHELSDCHNDEFEEPLDVCIVEEGTSLSFLITARESFDVSGLKFFTSACICLRSVVLGRQ
jgi:hypothetical protein